MTPPVIPVCQEFTGVEMDRARFREADLSGSDFGRCSLVDADFREAKLAGADFSQASLENALFRGANLFTADLRSAALRGARELTSGQLAQARTSETTILPNGARGPYLKNSGAERPAPRRKPAIE